MTRLAISKLVLRDLAIRSRNKCAFPGCDHPILNERNNYIAELCHIEAAEPGGPRYNASSDDEVRRSYRNLLFLCHQHHKETDNEGEFPVERLRQIKEKHETLPEVLFDHEVLLQRIDAVAVEQARMIALLTSAGQLSPVSDSYPIVGPVASDAWTPDRGRFYEFIGPSDTSFTLYEKDGWLHIEQRLADGATAYYEINESGSCRQSQMPYPINEYRVEIPLELVLRRTSVPSTIGTHAIRTDLKWSAGYVVEHLQGNLLAGVDCHARTAVDHVNRAFMCSPREEPNPSIERTSSAKSEAATTSNVRHHKLHLRNACLLRLHGSPP